MTIEKKTQLLFKRPESILVVIYCSSTGRVLLLQRRDDTDFWQSVTGSLEEGESAKDAALREVHEEIGIDITHEQLTLINCHHYVEFDIFPHFRHRYAPEVSRNLEHWFCLVLHTERQFNLTEHHCYCWLSPELAMNKTKSWSNRQAIAWFVPQY